ncbi:DUF935 family protein [uncultured Microscilla sp.]|uniref:phage portal protein family protein n=1 Tax=uncultured Microscilla sp. TaxID=432653 RepID=UPI0026334CAF|nr:DUF935 family protein [uncultured Microscilla sp.]
MKNNFKPLVNRFGQPIVAKSHIIASKHDAPEKNRGQVIKLVEHTKFLYKIDIAHWRNAHQVALNTYRPRRDLLMDVYQDAILDTHLKSVIESRMLPVLNITFEVVDEQTNEVDEDTTRLLTTKWFYKYLKAILESIAYGFSVVQLKLDRGIITGIETVPRENVIPEKNSILPDLQGEELVRFDTPGYNNLYTLIGEPEGMGLLLQAARFTIFKKHSLAHWQMFQRLFGIPMRIAKSNTNDKATLAKIENNLKNMGSAMYAVMPLGTEIEIKESVSRDAFNVFSKGIDVANKEVSKLFLGGTMTNEDGSSHSQAKEHGNSKNELIKADIRLVELEVNGNIFKQFIKWGVPLQGKRFRFNRSRKLPLADNQLEIDKWLAGLFELEPQYIRDTYGTVIGERIKLPTPSGGGSKGEPGQEQEQESNALPITSVMNQASIHYSNTCAHAINKNISNTQASNTKIPERLQEILDRLTEKIFKGEIKAGDFDNELFEFIANLLWAHVKASYGYKFSDLAVNSKRYKTLAALQENVYTFAAIQVHQNIQDLVLLKASSEDKATFNKAVTKVNKQYNKTWLDTNRQATIANSQSAARWHDWQENKDILPNVEFQTIGDDRVRDSHKKLEGAVVSIDDPLLKIYNTPLDYKCRCEWIQTHEDLKPPKELPKIPLTFQNNPGETGKVFTKDHPFWSGISDKKKKEYAVIVKDLITKTNKKKKT